MIPPSYRQPVAGTPIPAADADVGDLWDSLDDQTGRLSHANGRSSDLISMADACQASQAKVLDALNPRPWWQFWRAGA